MERERKKISKPRICRNKEKGEKKRFKKEEEGRREA